MVRINRIMFVIMYIVEKYLDLVKYTLFLLQLQVLL